MQELQKVNSLRNIDNYAKIIALTDLLAMILPITSAEVADIHRELFAKAETDTFSAE